MKKSLLGISLLTITCLYGLLGIIIIPITYMAGVDTIIGIYITIGIIVLQFLLAPFFTDLSMKWFYKAKFNEEIPEYLKTFNQGNVQSNTGNKYACGVVAATFDLAMQNRIYKSTWNTYNEIYKNANVENGGTYGDSVAKSLNKYYKRYYKSNGFKAYFKDTKVRFASIKKFVDSNYKSILDLYVKKSGHAVPVLGYYSYFFDS